MSDDEDQQPASTSDRPRRRIRAMLRNFYGLQTEGEAPSNPLDLDGVNFDVKMFSDKMLTEHSLQYLLDYEGRLSREVKTLDGDMKTLVYENYNRFISATDTIRKMKSNVNDMQDQMKNLNSTMDEISKGSATVNTSLVEKRDKITRLSSVSSMLKKLQFLFELPAKLRKCLETESYSQAYQYYTKTKTILEHHAHIPSFKNIQTEIAGLIREMVLKLQANLLREELTSDEITETVQLLLNLKEDPESLWKKYLTCQERELKKSLRKLEIGFRKASALPPPQLVVDENGQQQQIQDPYRIIEEDSASFLSKVTTVTVAFHEMFIGPDPKVLSDEQINKSEKQLNNIANALVKSLMDLIENTFDVLLQSAYWSKKSSKLLSVISLWDNNIKNIAKVTRVASLVEDYRNFSLKLINASVVQVFDNMLNTFSAAVDQLGADSKERPEALGDIYQRLLDQLTTSMMRNVPQLELFMDTPAEVVRVNVKTLSSFIVTQATQHFRSILDKIRVSGLQNTRGSTPMASISLILSKLSITISTTVARDYFNTVAESFSKDNRRSNIIQEINECESLCRNMAQELLNRFVELTGQQISHMIRSSIDNKNWLVHREPRRVSKLWEQVIADIITVNSSVQQLFPSDGYGRAGSDSSRRTGTATKNQLRGRLQQGYQQNMMSDIDRLFSEKIEIYSGNVEYTRSSIIEAIVKIVLKTCIEFVRLKTFSRGGFQQIEVDAEYLRQRLWNYAPENILQTLLQEVVMSTFQRCLDPVSMESSVIAQIVSVVATDDE